MEKILGETVSGDSLISWLVIAFLVGYFIYKEWPEFKRRMTSGSVKDATEEKDITAVKTRLGAIEGTVTDIKDKLDRDYRRINDIEKELARHRKDQLEDRKEMMLIMQGLLAALKGLQQLSCNGPVTETIDTLTTYLTEKAHDCDMDGTWVDKGGDNS